MKEPPKAFRHAKRIIQSVFPGADVVYDHGGDVESILALGFSIDRPILEDGKPFAYWTLHRVVKEPYTRDDPGGSYLLEVTGSTSVIQMAWKLASLAADDAVQAEVERIQYEEEQ